MLAAVPLTTKTYGSSPGHLNCYIYANNDVALIERFALWDGPATCMFILLAASIAMVVMVIKMTGTVCLRLKYEPITDGDQFWKALKQLLPLAAFPILFFIFEIPVLILHIYVAKMSTPNDAVNVSGFVFFSMWGVASGATLTIHITVAQIRNRKRKHENPIMQENASINTKLITTPSVNSATRFSLPPISV